MLEKWINRAKKHPVITVVTAFIVWFIPLVISIDANRLARQSIDISQLQANPHITTTEIFYGAEISREGHVGLCRHVILLSNQGGVGTAVFSIDTKVSVGSQIVVSMSSGTGNDESVQYYTRFYTDSTEALPLHETVTTNSMVIIQPLYSFLIVPSGETVALTIDTEVVGHFKSVARPVIGPGTSGERTEVKLSDGNISVEYTLHFPDNQQITTRTMGCLTLSQ